MNLKGFIEGLAKEKYLVYFLLAWAGVLFFWALSNIVGEATNLKYAYNGIYLFSDLFELGQGAILALLSVKLLSANFMANLKKEVLVAYFLLLWAGSFFFGAIGDIAYDAQWGIKNASDGIGILGTISSFIAGVVLALVGWKLLQAKDQPANQP